MLCQGGESDLLSCVRWYVVQHLLHLLFVFLYCIAASPTCGVSAVCSEWENYRSPRLEKPQITQQVLMFAGSDFA